MIIEPEKFREETKRITIKIWVLYFLVAVIIYLVSSNNLIFVTGEIIWLIAHSIGSTIWWKARENGFKCIRCGNKCEDASTQVSNVNAVKSIMRHCSVCKIDYRLGAVGDNDPVA